MSIAFSNVTSKSGDTLKIDISASKIHWKGTKMFGVGKHEGEVSLSKGHLILKRGNLAGGDFMIDMRSLTVTDIPKTDPVPIRNLNNHLKSKDFFDVDGYPVARFIFNHVKQIQADSLQISGNLTMRGIKNPVVFKALKKGNQYQAKFKIDRFKWNAGYTGSWADKTLVDRDIELDIRILAR